MAIKKDILDQLLAGRDPKEVFAKDGLLDDLKKAFGALRKVPNKRHQSLVQQENFQKNAHFRDFPEVSIWPMALPSIRRKRLHH